jgi:NADPH oxidase 2
MSILTAAFTILCGIGSLIWGIERPDTLDAIAGSYAIIYGLVTYAYEKTIGESRTGDKCPWRAIGYTFASIPLWFSVPTIFAATFVLCVIGVNVVAAQKGEEYDAPKPRKASKPKPKPAAMNPNQADIGILAKILNWIKLQVEQNEVGAVVFVGLYIIANFVIFFTALATWIKKNDDFGPKKLSPYGPWAKGFGNMLDLNCSFIVVPVLRTMIRWLYNKSTADEACFARSLRAVLAFVPLDRALEFHKFIAKLIVFGAVGHTVFHLINYVESPGNTMDKFGAWPWVSGGIIFIAMLFIYSSAFPAVKHPQFELFWYSHHMFTVFFLFLLLHGGPGWNPNFWRWFVGPGTLYILERVMRMYRAKQDVVLLSVTHMKPSVYSLEFAKEGVFKDKYQEGQYIFINAPHLSQIQWHPFTISSAPQEKTVTVHIKIMGPGSWTRGLRDYLQQFSPAGATYHELTRQTEHGIVQGKVVGPDGLPLLQIDGPHSAPTQHVSEYTTVMVAGAGIGVTPVAATLKSVILHRWKYYLGHIRPNHAYFFWVCSHRDIDAFRWLIRAIKDCEDNMYDMRSKNERDMHSKRFEFHIYITSVPKDAQPIDVVVDDDIGFWGVPSEDSNIEKVRAPFNEIDLYRIMKYPEHHTVIGDIHIWKGRPTWDDRFQAIREAHPRGEIGVAFCGNPFVAAALKEKCYEYSSVEDELLFRLHKENF